MLCKEEIQLRRTALPASSSLWSTGFPPLFSSFMYNLQLGADELLLFRALSALGLLI
jgi:hypothetical protein